jgi:hypothetical protein
MLQTTDQETRRFGFDADRLAKFLFERGEESFGIDPCDEDGLGRAIANRFNDAEEAGAIDGPVGVRVVLYPVAEECLIVTVRERKVPHEVPWPLRQVATFSFDPEEVACRGDETFAECCRAIRELLRRADALLPGLRALAGSSGP